MTGVHDHHHLARIDVAQPSGQVVGRNGLPEHCRIDALAVPLADIRREQIEPAVTAVMAVGAKADQDQVFGESLPKRRSGGDLFDQLRVGRLPGERGQIH